LLAMAEAHVIRYFQTAGTEITGPTCLSLLIGPQFGIYAISGEDFCNVQEVCHLEFTNAAEEMTEKVIFMIHNHLLHQKKFVKTNIAVLNSQFTLVPQAYAGEDLRSLLRFSTGAPDIKNMLRHNLKDASFCFAIEPALNSYLEKIFPNASIRHVGAVNISLLSEQHSLAKSQIFLCISDGMMEIVAKQNGGLLFYNTFNYQTDEDILYYLLFMMEQFSLDPPTMKLVIAGQKSVTDDLVKTIKKYIGEVGFCVNDPSVKLSDGLAALPHHYYFTLLNQHLCEL
jgi:hypothetical protein